MNPNRPFKLLFLALLLLLFFVSGINSFASNNTRQIILTGKVSNAEIGNPVANHKIYVISESVNSNNASYFKVIVTDEEGFYYDTLTTSLNKGSLRVYTYDGNNKIQEQKLYFRFIELRSSNIFVADFSIYMPYQSESLQANFKYLQKNEEDHFNYQFIDLTANENVKTWHWNFGDGGESKDKNPEHIFAAPGLYKIKLTISVEINGFQKFSSISKYIYVSERSYYHLGGHCFAGYFPIDMGKAFLFYIDEYQNFIPIDTSSFDTLGYYYFYEIPEGEYCIKVQPKSASEFYGKMVPTYFGGEVFWKIATHINHHETNWEYDIHLVEGQAVEQGFCSVSGNIAFGDTLTNSRSLPAEGIDFFLLNEEGSILSSHYSNDKGNFSFENIDDGNYWLTTDIPGYERKNKLVELTDENPDLSNIEIIIENGDINMSVEDEVFSKYNYFEKLYPNPAKDWVTLEVSVVTSGIWTFEILDSQGRKLQSESINLQNGNATVKLNVSTLKSGHYIILVKNEGKTTGRPLVVNK